MTRSRLVDLRIPEIMSENLKGLSPNNSANQTSRVGRFQLEWNPARWLFLYCEQTMHGSSRSWCKSTHASFSNTLEMGDQRFNTTFQVYNFIFRGLSRTSVSICNDCISTGVGCATRFIPETQLSGEFGEHLRIPWYTLLNVSASLRPSKYPARHDVDQCDVDIRKVGSIDDWKGAWIEKHQCHQS